MSLGYTSATQAQRERRHPSRGLSRIHAESDEPLLETSCWAASVHPACRTVLQPSNMVVHFNRMQVSKVTLITRLQSLSTCAGAGPFCCACACPFSCTCACLPPSAQPSTSWSPSCVSDQSAASSRSPTAPLIPREVSWMCLPRVSDKCQQLRGPCQGDPGKIKMFGRSVLTSPISKMFGRRVITSPICVVFFLCKPTFALKDDASLTL